MKEKSCKLFINIVFLIILIITIFNGNKVMGAPTESEKIKSTNFDSEYNYYNANSCGNSYNRELIKDSKSTNAVYGCVTNKSSDDGSAYTTMVCSSGSPVKQGSDNGPVWVCVYPKNSTSNPNGNQGGTSSNLRYTAEVSSAFFDSLIDAYSCNNAALVYATFKNNSGGVKDIKSCMYDGQEGFASCPDGSKENLLNISDNYGSVYGFKVCTKTTSSSGDSNQGGSSTTTIPNGGGTTTQEEDKIKELTCIYDGYSVNLPHPFMIHQDKNGKITISTYEDYFIDVKTIKADSPGWKTSNKTLNLEATGCEKDGVLRCCARYLEYTDSWGTAKPVDKKKWYKNDYKLLSGPTSFSSIDDYMDVGGETGPRNDYSNVCNNEGVKSAVLFIGKLVRVAIWAVPLIIIVLGMVDFTKAITSSDEKAVSKATAALIKRIVAGLSVFLIPTIIIAILQNIGIKGIDQNSCVNCLLYCKCIFVLITL